MAIVFALGISLLAGALTAQAASGHLDSSHFSTVAAGSVESDSVRSISIEPATETTCLLDNDSDGVANPDDPDVDGDGAVNGEDNDIDGDGVVNANDGDPVATNCDDSAAPPILAAIPPAQNPNYEWQLVTTFSLLGASLLGIAVALIFRRKPKTER